MFVIESLAIQNYRSILDLQLELGRLNVITGANGSGKSNLYKALRLLAMTAQGNVIPALAQEGGLQSTFWAGPSDVSRAMRAGESAVEGQVTKGVKRMQLGFATAEFSYAIALGLPEPSASAFTLDPEIKREAIWYGPLYRPATSILERKGPVIKVKSGRSWQVQSTGLASYSSIFDGHPGEDGVAEMYQLRDFIRSWRFYDHFRTDCSAPARQAQLATRTPVLHHDGRDVAAALQTILEIGDSEALAHAIDDAFPGSRLQIDINADGRFGFALCQPGMLRPLAAAELSDGSLRYILWVAALLTPRPPPLMILNEPETSLHKDLLPALARLIVRASRDCQIWLVSHDAKLIDLMRAESDGSELCCFELDKQLGASQVVGQGLLDGPAWRWPK